MIAIVGLAALCIPLMHQLLLEAVDIVTVAAVWMLSLSSARAMGALLVSVHTVVCFFVGEHTHALANAINICTL